MLSSLDSAPRLIRRAPLLSFPHSLSHTASESVLAVGSEVGIRTVDLRGKGGEAANTASRGRLNFVEYLIVDIMKEATNSSILPEMFFWKGSKMKLWKGQKWPP